MAVAVVSEPAILYDARLVFRLTRCWTGGLVHLQNDFGFSFRLGEAVSHKRPKHVLLYLSVGTETLRGHFLDNPVITKV
jgi:hypothetical protein